MATNKLSDSNLKTYLGKPQPRSSTLADGLGLSARISVAGGISWLYRYREPLTKKVVWVTLGKYPDLSLKQARVERDKCREWVAMGLDPRTERKLLVESTVRPKTVFDAIDLWLTEHAQPNRTDYDKLRKQLDLWIISNVGELPLSGMTQKHWRNCFSIRAKQYPVAAGYALQSLTQAMKFCRKRGFDIHPDIFDLDLELVGAKRQNNKNRTLIEEDSWSEFTDLLNWLNAGNTPPYYRNLIILLIVLGARTQELRKSRISEWDLDSMVWTVPVEHNKVGKRDTKKGKSGEIKRPIPHELLPLVNHLVSTSSNDYLLGEYKEESAVSNYGGRIWKKLNHQNKWSLHDLRRTVATGMSDLEIDPYIVEAMLGHSLGGVQGIYNRSHYLSKKQKALEVWVSKLRELGLNLNPLFSVE
ncbi:TPA: integrase arm-type DNA-binding domain-containing protein [Vibrio parahaemolyticus]|nr:integrase arm-type DNA-binding domain-containing protein [Vibrio parahaemolyticus]